MVDATISRDGTSVSLPLVDNSSGTPLVSRDIGKPHLAIRNVGAADPYMQDRYSALENYTLTGWLKSATAFDDAITLADLLKNHGQGSPITLDIPLDGYDDNIKVVPAAEQEQAVTLAYEPGDPWVGVDLSLTRVSAYQGASSVDGNLISNTPTASGDGPIQLSDPGTSTTIDLTNDIVVERTTGRPNSTLSRRTDKQYPQYIDKIKTAFDEFSISFQATEGDTIQTVRDLNDMILRKRGTQPLKLNFNGVYGMGEMSVAPVGSQAQRDTKPSGYEGISIVPTLSLRRVRTP
jgi:hypothetical protein